MSTTPKALVEFYLSRGYLIVSHTGRSGWMDASYTDITMCDKSERVVITIDDYNTQKVYSVERFPVPTIESLFQ